MKKQTALTAVLLLLSPLAVLAQTGPDDEPDAAPGYVNNVFHSTSVDSINLYNGQLTIPIALGPSYPVGPKLKFQLMMTYATRGVELGHPAAQIADYTYSPVPGNPALGVNWNFTLGAIKVCYGAVSSSGVCYFGPDGSQHAFTKSEATPLYYRTEDATQLRLHNLGSEASPGPWEMWDGDGNRYSFSWHVAGFDDPPLNGTRNYVHDFGLGRDGWYLDELKDPFGNTVSVTYYSNVVTPKWTYTDLDGHPGDPCPDTQVQPPSSSLQTWIPQAITLPAGTIGITLDGATHLIQRFSFPVLVDGVSTTRDWTLNYATVGVGKNCTNNSGYKINEWLLTSIGFPSQVTPPLSYTFEFGCNKDNPANPNEPPSPFLRMSLPTGAQVLYRLESIPSTMAG